MLTNHLCESLQTFNWNVNHLAKAAFVFILALGRTRKLITPPPPPRGTREGGLMEPPLGFHYVTIFRKVFTFSRKPVMCSTE